MPSLPLNNLLLIFISFSQHLCPNRVKYLDEELVSQLIPKDTNTQNEEMCENMGIASNIMIPQMIALPQISRYSPKKKKRERSGLQIIPIPEIREMPQISGVPETMEIPVTPEMIDIRDMPILVPQIKKELTEEVSHKKYNSVHQEIDRLIEGNGYLISPEKLNLNPNQNNSVKEEEEDSNGSDDEIQIVDEIIGQHRTVSPEFKQLIEVKNVTLDRSKKTFEKGMSELEKLNICRPHFERKMDDNVGLRYVCRCCKFPAKSLEAISTHLRLRHFIEN